MGSFDHNRVPLHELEAAQKRLKVWDTIIDGLGFVVIIAVISMIIYGVGLLIAASVVNPYLWWVVGGLVVFLCVLAVAIGHTVDSSTVNKADMFGTIDE